MLARSVLWNWIGLIITGGISFLMTPFLVRSLGSFYYGLWILVASVIDYCGLLDLGLSNSMQRFIALYQGGNDREGVDQTVAAALVLNTGAATIVALAAIFLSPIVAKFFHAKADDLVFRHTLILMGLSVAANFPLKSLTGFLSGMQRFDLKNISTMTTVGVRSILIILVLRHGYGVVAVAAATLVTSCVSVIPVFVFIHLADPELRIVGQFSFRRVRQLLTFSVFTFLTVVGDYFNFQSDSVVISRYLSVALVTPFAVAFSLMRLYQMVMGSITVPLVNRMISIDGRLGQNSRTNGVFLRYTKYVSLVAVLGAVLLVLNGRSLLILWIGRELPGAYAVLATLTISFLADLAQAPSMHLLYSRERHRWMGAWNIGAGIINVVLSIVLCLRYGLIGVALGTVIPMLIIKLAVQPLYVLRVARISVGDYLLGAVLRPLLIGMAFVALCYWISSCQASTWGQLIANIGWQLMIFGAMVAVIGFTRTERAIVRSGARTAFARLQWV